MNRMLTTDINAEHQAATRTMHCTRKSQVNIYHNAVILDQACGIDVAILAEFYNVYCFNIDVKKGSREQRNYRDLILLTSLVKIYKN